MANDLGPFSRVPIDPEVRTLMWPNGADLDPAILQDEADYAPEMREMAGAG